MFNGITSHAGTLVIAIVVLTGAAILCNGAAAADPDQDDQFLALLDKEEIPAVVNVPSVIAAAHKVCRRLDSGVPVEDLVGVMQNDMYSIEPALRRYPVRVTTTVTRFITAAVETYCPSNQSKIVSITANPATGSNGPKHRVAAYKHNAVNVGSGLPEPLPDWMGSGVYVAGRHGGNGSDCGAYGTVLASLTGAVPSGEITPPNPPQIPTPPPQTAQIRTPPRTVAAPSPPQQPPPPPPQVEPPAVGPQPGGAAGSGGSDGSGGDGSGAEAPPTPAMPPGFVRLAP
jgi:hypothetical protein